MKTKLLLSVFFHIAFIISYGQEWTRTYLSEGTSRMGGAVLGNKAYFAGGLVEFGGDWVETDKVEIYDIGNDQWAMDYLSQARQFVTPASCGGFAFFAGGLHNWEPSSRVDIFNSQYYWKETELSVPRFQISSASKDSLVLFAGGNTFSEVFNVVDIYNINTEQWSIDTLSIPRGAMGCAVIGDIAFFAGGGTASGVTNRIDIYNFTTGTWDTASLSQARSHIGATVAGNKVIFAGGSISNGVPSDRVDIYDYETDTWDTATLSVARGFYHQSATVDGVAYFVGSGIFDLGWIYPSDIIDMYDPGLNSWSVMTLPNFIVENAVVAIDNSLISAGGFWENNPPYGIALDNVEIYTDTVIDGIASDKKNKAIMKVYPNPSDGEFRIDLSKENYHNPLHITIYNLQGQEVFNCNPEPGNPEISINLPAGLYFYRIQAGNKVSGGKIVIVR